MQSTRREFLGTSGVGRGLVAGSALSWLGGCASSAMLLFKQDKRNPGDATLSAVKALMKTVPDDTFTDLAAYYSSVR